MLYVCRLMITCILEEFQANERYRERGIGLYVRTRQALFGMFTIVSVDTGTIVFTMRENTE